MDCGSEVEMFDHGGDVGRVVIHIVTVADLGGAAVAASIMSDDAIALREEIKHLGIPVVCAQRPAMVKNDRLCVARTPVLVKNLDVVLGSHSAHAIDPFRLHVVWNGGLRGSRQDWQSRESRSAQAEQ
ncbi:hypothetical protein D9M72_532310 [compost metagenome]